MVCPMAIVVVDAIPMETDVFIMGMADGMTGCVGDCINGAVPVWTVVIGCMDGT